jgi:hypothetical protein
LQVISISQDAVVPDDVVIVSSDPAPEQATTIGLLEGPATAETAALIQAGLPGGELAQSPVLTDPADPAVPPTPADPTDAPDTSAGTAATPVSAAGASGAPSTTVTPVATGTSPATGTATSTGTPATADGTTAVTAAAPADGVPHLPSPDSPPPGTSDEPVGPDTNPNVSYLKDLWHAVQNQEIDRSDLLLALTQRSFTAPLPSGTNSNGVMTGANSNGVTSDPSVPASTGAASAVPVPAGTTATMPGGAVPTVPAATSASPVLIPVPVPAEVPADQ